MSIPTTQEIPSLLRANALTSWSQRLQEFFRTNLQSFAWPESRVALANGNNNNVNIKGGYVVYVIGPTGPFAIGGIGGGTPGRQIILCNRSSGTMSLSEAAAGSAVGNRIITGTGAVIAKVATLIWSHQDTSWILVSSR